MPHPAFGAQVVDVADRLGQRQGELGLADMAAVKRRKVLIVTI